MTIRNSDSLNYFRNHEAQKNKFFNKLVIIVLIIIPLMIIAGKTNLLPAIDIRYFSNLVIIMLLSVGTSHIILVNDPFSPAIKYLLILTAELICFIFSINQNTEMYMSFCVIPVISCVYLEKNYTRNICIINYFAMIISLGTRAITKQFFYEANYTRLTWFYRYAIGMTIEYIVFVVVISFLSRNNFKLVEADYKQTTEELVEQNSIISSFMELLNKNSGINQFHPQRCSEYTSIICKNLRKKNHYTSFLTEENIPYITTAALVHDIGLLAIPKTILNKKTALTELEIQEFRLHTVQGELLFRQQMNSVESNLLDIFCDVILYHHEQWNGQGYPYQLAENAIPVSARIVFAANTLDNLTNDVPGRKAVSFDEAISLIKRMGGREIDPVIAQVVYESREELKLKHDKMKENMI